MALLRHADGGGTSPLGTLQGLPIIWVAINGSRRDVAIVMAAVTAALIVPIVAIGAPAYPADEWRHAAINLSIGALIGFTVESLTRQNRRHTWVARERANALAQ